MKKNYSRVRLCGAFLMLTIVSIETVRAQTITISEGSTFHYEGGSYRFGVVDNELGGVFSTRAALPHSETSYVKGAVSFIEAQGPYQIAIGENSVERKPIFISQDKVTISYLAGAVPLGTAPKGYVLANKELYTFDGEISMALASPLSTTTFGTADGSIIPVFTDEYYGTWTKTLVPGVTKFMAFARADSSLGIDEFDPAKFVVYPNPVQATNSNITFDVPSVINQLSVTLYDVTGRVVASYDNVNINSIKGSIPKPVDKGVYLLKFTFNDNSEQILKRVIVE